MRITWTWPSFGLGVCKISGMGIPPRGVRNVMRTFLDYLRFWAAKGFNLSPYEVADQKEIHELKVKVQLSS